MCPPCWLGSRLFSGKFYQHSIVVRVSTESGELRRNTQLPHGSHPLNPCGFLTRHVAWSPMSQNLDRLAWGNCGELLHLQLFSPIQWSGNLGSGAIKQVVDTKGRPEKLLVLLQASSRPNSPILHISAPAPLPVLAYNCQNHPAGTLHRAHSTILCLLTSISTLPSHNGRSTSSGRLQVCRV